MIDRNRNRKNVYNPPTTTTMTIRGGRRSSVLIPLMLLVMMLVAGYVIQNAVKRSMTEVIGDQLDALQRASVSSLRMWFAQQQSHCTRISRLIRQPALKFARETAGGSLTARTVQEDEYYAQIKTLLDSHVDSSEYVGWTLQTPTGVVLAAWDETLVGRRGFPLPVEATNHALTGVPTVSVPFRLPVPVNLKDGGLHADVPVLAVIAPIEDDEGRSELLLSLFLSPLEQFTSVLSISRSGQTGDTFAFNIEGLMISGSRRESEFRSLGLLPQNAAVTAVLNIHLRDPEVDLSAGKRATKPIESLAFTRMAIDATRGGSDMDLDGYRDCRGVPVIGAWTWLPEYGMGVATQIEVEEAFQPLRLLRWSSITMFALLSAVGGILMLATVRINLVERKASKEHRLARKLGQYRLEELLGEGGMGRVYKAQHALLMRPVAIKVLQTQGSDSKSLHRFRREVELTSQLSNPHTVDVYDYGQTQDGDFYYVMEYLDGLDLGELVRSYGSQPSSRVINVLLQICGSLAEAHSKGLVHRDIKPANIMVSHLGGIYDFAKLLDFGLVKESDPDSPNMTHEGSLAGTPMYMSPEAITDPRNVDSRADIYSIGAVGYFLVTGKPMFDAAGTVDALLNQINEQPARPSERAGKSINHDFETILLACLAKSPQQRPASVTDLIKVLQACARVDPWTQETARQWWKETYRGTRRASTILSGKDTIVPSYGGDERALDARVRSLEINPDFID